MFNFCQFSPGAAETVESKHTFEHFAWDEGFKIKSYHSDNGIFSSAKFTSDCEKLDQKINYSGVGAQHQNGVAERNIKIVASWAQANLLHAAYHWPKHISVCLWPMTIQYAVCIFNHLLVLDTGVSPNEIWSQTRSSCGVTQSMCLRLSYKMVRRYQSGIQGHALECSLSFLVSIPH